MSPSQCSLLRTCNSRRTPQCKSNVGRRAARTIQTIPRYHHCTLLRNIQASLPLKSGKIMTAAIAMSGSDPWRADAARYKVMWRIVPSVNHKLAGSMQPITMLASMLVRHVQRPQPDMQALTKLAVDMQQACKAAITTRPDVLAWFQPSEHQTTSIATEVAQCDNLLTGEFAIRGSSIDNQTVDANLVCRPGQCARSGGSAVALQSRQQRQRHHNLIVEADCSHCSLTTIQSKT